MNVVNGKRNSTQSAAEADIKEIDRLILSSKRDSIRPEWRSGWRATDASGVYETRRHVGASADGFHPGIERVFRAGSGSVAWGEAYATPEKARAAAAELEPERWPEMEPFDVEDDFGASPRGQRVNVPENGEGEA